ncbi:hypothetical protein [Kitasatospora sp. MMS16-BH015]|uniref:hypothetical protein n=1 Tax=Kitasatospora sp. MMS16-BH015 TaxID=2018025 RepID=UPI00131A5949|nr:hypothetical protein [Kitasatospora sp. MMS16-BH015]
MTTSTDLDPADIAALLHDVRSSATRLAAGLDAHTDVTAHGSIRASRMEPWARHHAPGA